MQIHYIKTHTEYFEESRKGNKSFEVRKDDREEKYKKS